MYWSSDLCSSVLVRRHVLGEIGDLHAGDLGHEDLAPLHQRQARQHEVDALLQGDPEAGHVGVGDRQAVAAVGDQLAEEWDDAAARAQHVAVAHHGKARAEGAAERSEEHTSELQSLMRISYAVFCLKKNNLRTTIILTR